MRNRPRFGISTTPAACTTVLEPFETCQNYYYPVFNRSKQMFALLIAHLIKADADLDFMFTGNAETSSES